MDPCQTRLTKIVATIGPASRDEATIRQLLQAGIDVARLNFSHGIHEVHAQAVERLRRSAKEMDRPICILQDLQGPKIRVGILPKEQINLVSGQQCVLTTRPEAAGAEAIPVEFPELPASVQPGGRILLDDGNLELSVLGVDAESVETRVVIGGVLKSQKGINLPGTKLDIPSLTAKDEADLAFGLQVGVDAVALSFVRSARDIHFLKETIARFSPNQREMPVVAKLEKPEALDNLEEIVQAAEGVMVARGDLGVEMSPEAVPIAQKRIIDCANRHTRQVITATQMLDSMIHNPRPTRAEASDVANAIFDGTDAVMLSGETAAGSYPVRSVEMMNAIICQAESHLAEWGHWKGLLQLDASQDDTFFTAQAARALAQDRNVAAIAAFTQSGRTALVLSKTRPGVPILAFTPNERTYQRMSAFWGVTPFLVPQADSIEAMIVNVEAVLMSKTSISAGQQVVLICGFPIPAIRQTNLALLHTVGC